MNKFGDKFTIQLIGSSHGSLVGVIIDGIPAGFSLDLRQIQTWLSRRKPGQSSITTPRSENDDFFIETGLFKGQTNGQPLYAFVKNKDSDSSYYEEIKDKVRPGHADYPAFIKYKGFNDYRGSGSFSGRMTIGLVIAGAIAKQLLCTKSIKVKAYTKSIGSKHSSLNLDYERTRIKNLSDLDTIYETMTRTPFIKDSEVFEKLILEKKNDGDSVGGVIECIIENMPVGLGEPFFDSLESKIAHMMFSIPAVKGIEFGSGFKASTMNGSDHNDIFNYDKDSDKVYTLTNNAGGILGGLSTGMPIVFRVAFKPTSSILKHQKTINRMSNETVDLTVKGRHDPCIVPRAVPVVECASAIVILDLLLIAGYLESAHLTKQ